MSGKKFPFPPFVGTFSSVSITLPEGTCLRCTVNLASLPVLPSPRLSASQSADTLSLGKAALAPRAPRAPRSEGLPNQGC